MKMKNIATLIAATAAVTFVTAPITATVANAKSVTCYGVNSCKGKHNSCKGMHGMKMSAKKCTKKGGSTTKPAATTTTKTETETTTTTEPTSN
jgi:hypothetical protein